MTPGQITYQLSWAGQNKNWQRVQELFIMLQKNFPDYYDPWSQYWYARALLETGDYTKALEMIVTTRKQIPMFEANNKLLDYAVKKIAGDFNPDIADPQEINYILELVEKNAPQDIVINFKIKLAKKFREKNQIYDALALLKTIDIRQISTERRKTAYGNVLSLAESYVLELSNLYLKTNQPHKAEKIINYIFKHIERPDKNAEKFLRDRMAQALTEQGKFQEAIQMLGPLLQLDEWIWYYRLAIVLKTIGQDGPAFYFGLQAALNRKQKPWYKIKVYLFLLSEFLERFTKDETRTIASFVVKLYADHGYGTNKTAQRITKYFNLDEQQLSDLKTLIKDTNQILQRHRCGKRLKGKITKIGQSQKFGFIRTKDGVTYYFQRSEVIGDWKNVKLGKLVNFCEGWGFDRRKSEIKKVAINVKVL